MKNADTGRIWALAHAERAAGRRSAALRAIGAIRPGSLQMLSNARCSTAKVFRSPAALSNDSCANCSCPVSAAVNG